MDEDERRHFQLTERHRDLEQRIRDEEKRPLPEWSLVVQLKREKLQVKQQLEQLGRQNA